MRVLLAIGCNQYEYANALGGAENDAKKIFDALTNPLIGDYSPTESMLLLSPSLEEVRSGITRVLFENKNIDTFTFFFAGHGNVRKGSFYMWLTHSEYDTQSVSALSLSDLFRNLNEAAPRQSNIIIDACESGGLIADLGTLLKQEILGDSGTPGVTLIATSAMNQLSGEFPDGGLGTTAILDCIEGRDYIQDNHVALDLIEIGRHIASRLAEHGQDPVVWGLNLNGPPRFCFNPAKERDPAKPLRSLVHTWPDGLNQVIAEHYDSLWKAYASASQDWEARNFADSVDKIFAAFSSNESALASLAVRFANASSERAKHNKDPFRQGLVLSTIAVSLLPYISHIQVKQAVRNLLELAGEALASATETLLSDLRLDPYILLRGPGTGLPQLFYLPVRLLQVLSWVTINSSIRNSNENRDAETQVVIELVNALVEHYEGSLVAISDAQTPCLAVILGFLFKNGLYEQGKKIIRRMWSSLVENGGLVARCNIPKDRVMIFLLARHQKNFKYIAEYSERPMEMLTVLLIAAEKFDMADELDAELWKLDHVATMAYVNSDCSQYSAEVMHGGQNAVWQIGFDIFRCQDLAINFPQIKCNWSSDESILVAISSLLYPDRIAWNVLQCDSPRDSQSQETGLYSDDVLS